MQNYIVLGAGYGDEGKGLFTDYLCFKHPNSLVIRFNGGHQAGHTVMHKDGKRHVFSNFGSGTLRNVPTYWSKYCTVEPVGFLEERKALIALGVTPKMYVDALCPVTTPWDIAYNKAIEASRRHGSVGVGFGATIARQEAFYKLHVQDLQYREILRIKLGNITSYYLDLAKKENIFEQYLEEIATINNRDFIDNVEEYLSCVTVTKEIWMMSLKNTHIENYIFEGAQGILLDMDFGMFPNVTRSNTTSKNALQLIADGSGGDVEIFYMTRAYGTRHGNGWLSNEDHYSLHLKNIENETNVDGDWQGRFRRGLLDIDMLRYAVESDRNFHKQNHYKTLVMTCRNQINGEFLASRKGILSAPRVEDFLVDLRVDDMISSYSPYGEEINVEISSLSL